MPKRTADKGLCSLGHPAYKTKRDCEAAEGSAERCGRCNQWKPKKTRQGRRR